MSFVGFWISGKTILMLVFQKAHFLNQPVFYYAVIPGDLPGDFIALLSMMIMTLYSLAGLLIWENSFVWLLNLKRNLEVLRKWAGSNLFILKQKNSACFIWSIIWPRWHWFYNGRVYPWEKFNVRIAFHL